ncbi:hypothetical protein FRB95_010819 [Tulasnella sp. JGI-2019a]|nr:hypothetical protein FRB95_010819 [Tulasnella sp. JGI-2019a]
MASISLISLTSAYNLLEQINVVNRTAIANAKQLQESCEKMLNAIILHNKTWKDGVADGSIDKAVTVRPMLSSVKSQLLARL